MKAIKISMMALAIAGAALSVHAQTADEVLQKHIDAIGGTKNWEKVKTVKLSGSMSQQGMEISMTQTIANGRGPRTDISAMGMNGYIMQTPKDGWMYMPFANQKEPVAIPEEQLKASKGNLNFNNSQLVDKSEIAKMSLEGKDTVNNVSCYKLKITNKEGEEKVCYIESTTYYMVKVEMKVKAQDEEQEVAMTYGDFKKQPEGIVIPMAWGLPGGQGDITFKTAEINIPIDDKTFSA